MAVGYWGGILKRTCEHLWLRASFSARIRLHKVVKSAAQRMVSCQGPRLSGFGSFLVHVGNPNPKP